MAAPLSQNSMGVGRVQGGWSLDQSRLDHPRGHIPRTQAGQRPPAAPSLKYANPYCPKCTPPLLFTRGYPVMGGLENLPGRATITPVYWAPSSYSYMSATYKTIINGYLQNVAAASQSNTNVFSVSTQYWQQSLLNGAPIQHIQYVVTAGAEIDDTNTFPASGGASGCTPAAGFTACVTDAALQTELRAKIPSNLQDDQHLYVVLFPANVMTCEAPNTTPSVPCSNNAYCAYHTAAPQAPWLIYTNQPFPDLKACADPTNGAQAPNGDANADTQIGMVSHEANESITDWTGAWMDSSGYENGDECALVFGQAQGPAGAFYNQVIGNGHYYTQDEFSNEDYVLGNGDLTTPTAGTNAVKVPGCVQQEELPQALFNPPPPANAGDSVLFDGSSSFDPDNSAAPLNYLWSFGDGTANGTGAKVWHMFCSGGTFTVNLSVTDSGGWQAAVSHQIPITVVRPIITGLSTNTGPASGGTYVSISGCALNGATAVNFGTSPATSFSAVSDRLVTATSPAHASGRIDIAVTTSLGTTGGEPTDWFTFAGLYVMDGYGGLHPDDSPPPGIGPYWAGWTIARAAKPLPGSGLPPSGLVLDGYGGLHPFGNAPPTVGQEPYFPNLDVARDLVFLPSGQGGYELDGWGGIHPFSLGNNPLPPQPWQYPYFPGQDVAKKITLLSDASGGYVLDAFGGIHPWSVTGKPLPVQIWQYGYWYGQDLARDMWLSPDSTTISASGYTLDSNGGFHGFWSYGATPVYPMAAYGYWPGRDLARAMWFLPGATAGGGNASGYTLDAYGGTHPFAVRDQPLPRNMVDYGYFPGNDIARAMWGA